MEIKESLTKGLMSVYKIDKDGKPTLEYFGVNKGQHFEIKIKYSKKINKNVKHSMWGSYVKHKLPNQTFEHYCKSQLVLWTIVEKRWNKVGGIKFASI